MEVSLALAQVLGPLYLVVGLGMVFNKAYFERVYKAFVKDDALMYLGGVFALLFGLIIVLMHNVWESGWEVLITILGWLAVLKGVLLILFPEAMKSNSKKWMEGNMMQVAVVVALVLGGVLTYFGYLQ